MTISELEQQLALAEERLQQLIQSPTKGLNESLAAFESVAAAQRELAAAKGEPFAMPHDLGFTPEAAVSANRGTGPLLRIEALTSLARRSSAFGISDLVLKGVHVDPESTASVESKAGVQTLSICRDFAQNRVFGPVHCAANVLSTDPFVLRQKFEVRAFRPQIGTNTVGNFFRFDPNGHAHRMASILFRIPNVLAPPHPRTGRRVTGWTVGKTKAWASIVRVFKIGTEGVIAWIGTPHMPDAIVCNGFVGWRDRNLKIVGPQFARTVKRRTKIDGAGFRRNIGDDFDLRPIRSTEQGTVRHWITGKHVSIGI